MFLLLKTGKAGKDGKVLAARCPEMP